jgi:hypothetical protein
MPLGPASLILHAIPSCQPTSRLARPASTSAPLGSTRLGSHSRRSSEGGAAAEGSCPGNEATISLQPAATGMSMKGAEAGPISQLGLSARATCKSAWCVCVGRGEQLMRSWRWWVLLEVLACFRQVCSTARCPQCA